MIWIALGLAACGICAVIVVRTLSRAPLGHQDETGFNYGERRRPKVRAIEPPHMAGTTEAEPAKVVPPPTRETRRPRFTGPQG